MTTAELGLITTAIVGVAAAAGPALVSWANRRHERVMTRSTRLYEQRRKAYEDVAAFLERTRLWVAPYGPNWPDDPTRTTADEWADLMARAAVAGSADVQARLAAFHEAVKNFYIEAAFLSGSSRGRFRALSEQEFEALSEQEHEELADLHETVEKDRGEVVKLIDEAEQAMRDELAML
jgi:hypothetical protein